MGTVVYVPVTSRLDPGKHKQMLLCCISLKSPALLSIYISLKTCIKATNLPTVWRTYVHYQKCIRKMVAMVRLHPRIYREEILTKTILTQHSSIPHCNSFLNKQRLIYEPCWRWDHWLRMRQMGQWLPALPKISFWKTLRTWTMPASKLQLNICRDTLIRVMLRQPRYFQQLFPIMPHRMVVWTPKTCIVPEFLQEREGSIDKRTKSSHGPPKWQRQPVSTS